MKGRSKAKTFILDTNVILHDATCIHQFQENDIVIPLVVIEEIDHFKRGSQVINFNAREFARTLDSITGNALFNGGISLGKGKGKVRIAITKGLSPEIQDAFREDTPDHRILSVALELQKKARVKNSVIRQLISPMRSASRSCSFSWPWLTIADACCRSAFIQPRASNRLKRLALPPSIFARMDLLARTLSFQSSRPVQLGIRRGWRES